MYFDFKAVVKKNKKHSKPVKTDIYKVVKKDVYCVASIDLDGTYYAIDIQTNEKYIISSKSYNISTKVFYAQQLVNNKRLQVNVLKQQIVNNCPDLYLPVAPGVGMLGNLVKNNLIEGSLIMFDLIRTFNMPKDNELARTEFLKFRNNYEEIRENILKKYGKSDI